MSAIPLTVLSEARPVLIANARELLDDAIYLVTDNRSARGFALAVLAREEMGKLAIVVRMCYRLREGQEVDWRRFKLRIHDHSAKLKIAAYVEAIRCNNLAGSLDPAKDLVRLASQPELRQWLETRKQDGIHVRLSSAAVTLPSAAISSESAYRVCHDARRLFQFFDGNDGYNPETTFAFGIQDIYGKTIALADDLCEAPETVKLPR